MCINWFYIFSHVFNNYNQNDTKSIPHRNYVAMGSKTVYQYYKTSVADFQQKAINR